VLIQPTGEDLAVMGSNLMSGRRRHELIELARRTVAEQLRAPAIAEALADLPPGAPERIARPDGPPSQWPTLVRSPAGREAKTPGGAAAGAAGGP
jgi:hypothetical protein